MPEPSPFVRPLSPRDQAVFDGKLAGRTNPQIAAELVITLKTVESHLERVRVNAGMEGFGPGWLVVLACRYTAWRLQGGK